jgi:dTDP-4-dehydrorhamnose 3,5-epimerase
MAQVRRFYLIENADTEIIRAWQGHKVERKWFFVTSGSFLIGLVKPDDWNNPDSELPVESFILSSKDSMVLHIPSGYANGFRALETGSKMIVFSDFTTEQGATDNFKFDSGLWFNFK